MSRRPRSAAVLLLAAAGSLTSAAIAAPAASAALSGPAQIAFLNAQRAKHAIPADIIEVPTWSAACKKHMDYIAATGDFGHYESGPLETVEGEWGGTHSVLISGGDAFDADGDNAFEHAPIHLMQMLSPFITRSGADRGCLVTQGDGAPLEGGPNTERVFAAPQTFSYPGDGATGVPTSESTYEFPFVPAASVGLNVPGDITRSSGTGPHLYFYFATAGSPGQSWNSRGVITAATLTGPAGAVEVRTVDNETPQPVGGGADPLGLFLSPGGIVLPVKPLTPGTTYTASVTFDPNKGDPVGRTWTFKTAGVAPSGVGGGGGAGGGGAGGGPGPAGSSGPAGGTGGGAAAPLPTEPARQAISKLKLRKSGVTFDAAAAGALWVTVERRTRKARGKKPARWTSRGSRAITAVAGANRVALKKLGKGTYRVRVRSSSAKGTILARAITTL